MEDKQPITPETRTRLYDNFGIDVHSICGQIDNMMLVKKTILEKQKVKARIISLINIITHLNFVRIDMQTAYRQYLSAKISHDERCAMRSLNIHMIEGYKRLYGYGKQVPESFWVKTIGSMYESMPSDQQIAYNQITTKIIKIGNGDVFDKDSRDYSVHYDLDVDKFYKMLKELNAETSTTKAIQFIELTNDIVAFLSELFAESTKEFIQQTVGNKGTDEHLEKVKGIK